MAELDRRIEGIVRASSRYYRRLDADTIWRRLEQEQDAVTLGQVRAALGRLSKAGALDGMPERMATGRRRTLYLHADYAFRRKAR